MKAKIYAFLGSLFGLFLTIGLFSFINSSFMMLKDPHASKSVTKFKVIKKQTKKNTSIKSKKKAGKKT